LYFTRWITHLCAPTFIFLAGLAAYLQLARAKTKADLSFSLVTRALWLILLEDSMERRDGSGILLWQHHDVACRTPYIKVPETKRHLKLLGKLPRHTELFS
jgi:hypothetical protein